MDRREAIQELANLAWVQGGANRDETIEALNLAIEALAETSTEDLISKADTISRQAVRNVILENYRRLGLTDSAMTELSDEVKSLPSVTPTEPVYGEWENVFYGQTDDSLAFRCNKCGKMSAGRHSYCPNCGAKMLNDIDYERATDDVQYCERYEPTYNTEDGSL